MNLLSLIPAAIGMYQSGQNQRASNNANAQAMQLERDRYNNFELPMSQMGLDIAKLLFGVANDSMDSGAFDWDSIVQNMDARQKRVQDQTLKSVSSANLLAGYRPGDTTASDSITRANREVERDFNEQEIEMKQNLPLKIMQMYSGVQNSANTAGRNAPGQGLSGAHRNQADRYSQMAGNPAGLMGAIQPWLENMGRTPSSEGGGLATGQGSQHQFDQAYNLIGKAIGNMTGGISTGATV
jgi:hypothetical protein